jgi:hypothetical protein
MNCLFMCLIYILKLFLSAKVLRDIHWEPILDIFNNPFTVEFQRSHNLTACRLSEGTPLIVPLCSPTLSVSMVFQKGKYHSFIYCLVRDHRVSRLCMRSHARHSSVTIPLNRTEPDSRLPKSIPGHRLHRTSCLDI